MLLPFIKMFGTYRAVNTVKWLRFTETCKYHYFKVGVLVNSFGRYLQFSDL